MARRRAAALDTSPPTTITVREATVGPLLGTIEVSMGDSSISEGSTPSTLATIMGMTVLVPWPISVLAMSRRTTPSSPSSTAARLRMVISPRPVKPAPCQPMARPMPEAVRTRVERLPEPASAAWPQRTARVWRLSSRTSAIVRSFGGLTQHLVGGHAFAQDLAEGGRVALPVGPALAQLRGRDVQLIGDAGHLQLVGEADLRGAEPAEGAVGRRVGGHDAALDMDVGAVIRAARVEHAAREDDGAERAVRAAVHDDLDVLGDEPSIGRHAGAITHDGRVPLGGRGDVLVAVVDHAHRLADALSEERGVDGHDRGVVLLAAEAAARLGLGDDRLLVGKAERALERGVDVVGTLHRAGDPDPAVRPRLGDHGLVLDVELLLVADAVLALGR